jgi:hypothetical protein
MTLSINPLSSLVANAENQVVSQITNMAGGANLPNMGDLAGKIKVDSLVSQLSGGLNSGLNGLTSGITSAAGGIGSSLSGALSGAQSALGGIGNNISSAVSGGLSNLQGVAGSISNVTADISGTIGKLTGGSLAGGLMNLAGSISGAAGMLNNILSLKRGANLPAGGQSILSQNRGSAIKLNPQAKNDWRVRISANWSVFGGNPMFDKLSATGGVVWPFLPTINVTSKANYNAIDTIHSNYAFQAYKGSQVDDITISGDFTCETEDDAAYWIAATTFFKTATKMFFGQGANAGNPPIICSLNGYGSSIFNAVPVVIKSVTIDLKDDVNYINCNTFGTNTWVPVLSTVSITVSPVYNRKDLRQFSLQSYATGKMTAPSGAGYI